MRRIGFVSNSSSSSFVVAIRKGYTWEQLIEDSGPMKVFAEELVDWLAKECPQLQSCQNIPLSQAKKYYGEHATPERLLEYAEELEYQADECKDLVGNPEEWFFGRGSASYNGSDEPIEIWLGYGGEIDGENFKLKGVGN